MKYVLKFFAFVKMIFVVLAHLYALQAQQDITIRSNSFVLDAENPELKIFGKLKWRGGLVLSSEAKDFGGLSGLVMLNQGKDLLAITDKGNWVRAKVIYNKGAPQGLINARLGPIRDAKGRAFNKQSYTDTEAITQLSDKSYLITFERRRAIKKFSSVQNKLGDYLSTVTIPDEMKATRRNQGLEALAVIKSGRFKNWLISFAEYLPAANGYLRGWLLNKDEVHRIHLRNIDDYSITDIAILANGDLIVLERFFRRSVGVRMRLRLIKAAQIKPNAKLTGEILLELPGGAYQVDNMEGISVHKEVSGKQILTLLSDDNFNFFQRTLLMQFELKTEE